MPRVAFVFACFAAVFAEVVSGVRVPAAEKEQHVQTYNNNSRPFDETAFIHISPEDYDALDEANSSDPLVQYLRKAEKKMASMMSESMDSKTLDKFQKANLSESCMQSMMIFFDSMRNYEPWAIKMMDAGTKMPEGMLTGAISSFGNYDSCLSVKGLDAGELVFTGKYCAISRNIRPPLSYDPEYLARELAKAKLIRKALTEVSAVELSLALKAGSTRMAMCLPSTCSDRDVDRIAGMASHETDMNLTVSFCETREQISGMDGTQVVLIVLIGGLIVFSLSCSLFDVVTRGRHGDGQDIDQFLQSGRPMSQSLLLSWSVFRAYHWITRSKPFGDRFAFVYGIRFLYLVWVIYGYSYAIQNFTAVGNTVNGREIVRNWLFQMCLNATLATETFIFVSGFLMTTCLIRQSNDHGIIAASCIVLVVKVMRTMPVILLGIALAIIAPLISSGPVWGEMMHPPAESCRRNWIPTALSYSNFVKPEDACLIHVWFNSLDMQLCLLAPIMTALMLNRPRIGLSFLLSVVCFSVTGTAVQIVKQSLPPVPIFYVNSIHFMETLKKYILDLYFLPMQHLSAFAIGSGTAVFIHNHPKIFMTNWLAVIGWIVSFGTKFVLLFVVYPWNTGSSVPSTFVSALYGSLCRSIWSLTHCWDFIAAATGYGGVLETIFAWPPWIPLARLTFTAHTFGPMLMLVTAGSTRAPYYFTHFLMFQRFSSFLLIDFAAGLTVSLILEGPLALSTKILMLHLAKCRRKRRSAHADDCNKNQKQIEMSTPVVDPTDRALFRRIPMLPKLVPSKSMEDHQITRVD